MCIITHLHYLIASAKDGPGGETIARPPSRRQVLVGPVRALPGLRSQSLITIGKLASFHTHVYTQVRTYTHAQKKCRLHTHIHTSLPRLHPFPPRLLNGERDSRCTSLLYDPSLIISVKKHVIKKKSYDRHGEQIAAWSSRQVPETLPRPCVQCPLVGESRGPQCSASALARTAPKADSPQPGGRGPLVIFAHPTPRWSLPLIGCDRQVGTDSTQTGLH